MGRKRLKHFTGVEAEKILSNSLVLVEFDRDKGIDSPKFVRRPSNSTYYYGSNSDRHSTDVEYAKLYPTGSEKNGRIKREPNEEFRPLSEFAGVKYVSETNAKIVSKEYARSKEQYLVGEYWYCIDEIKRSEREIKKSLKEAASLKKKIPAKFTKRKPRFV